MTLPEVLWRLGIQGDPLSYPPPEKYGWNNRYDDSEQGYRSLYSAVKPYTCLLEVYADLRPDARTLAELDELPDAGDGHDALSHAAGRITLRHLQERVLTPARIAPSDVRLADLREPSLREGLKRVLARMMVVRKIPHLTLGVVLGEDRAVTQVISRQLYDEGFDGILFPSKHDDEPCVALFEGRANYEPAGPSELLHPDHPLVIRLCQDFGLHF